MTTEGATWEDWPTGPLAPLVGTAYASGAASWAGILKRLVREGAAWRDH